jgi:hypothetical protein
MATSKTSQQVDRSDSLPIPPDHLVCGYTIDRTEEADNKWKCIYCLRIIKEPIQLTECGHRSCKGCYESRAAASTDGNMVCPIEDCECEFEKTQVRIICCIGKRYVIFQRSWPIERSNENWTCFKLIVFTNKTRIVVGQDH